MWPDWVSNPGLLTYESGALPTALCGPAISLAYRFKVLEHMSEQTMQTQIRLLLEEQSDQGLHYLLFYLHLLDALLHYDIKFFQFSTLTVLF